MTVADFLLTAAIPAGLVYLILTRRLSGEQRRARQAIADAKAAQAAIASTAMKAHRAGVQAGYALGQRDGYREAVNRTTRDATVARLLEGVAL